MGEEDAFLNAIAEDPSDLDTHLVYSDWLDDRGEERAAACLRAWCAMASVPCSEAAYPLLQTRIEHYRLQLQAADPAWVQRLAKARDWVDTSLAERVARLYLRVRHGRKADRQWIDQIQPAFFVSNEWSVSYWRNPPTRRKARHWRAKSCLRVDRFTAEVQEPG